MNERIKELLVKAQALARTEVEQDPKFKPPYHIPATEVHVGLGLSYEKFAELIVQRTLDIVNSHTEIFQTDRDKAVIEHIKQSIKTDFGIK